MKNKHEMKDNMIRNLILGASVVISAAAAFVMPVFAEETDEITGVSADITSFYFTHAIVFGVIIFAIILVFLILLRHKDKKHAEELAKALHKAEDASATKASFLFHLSFDLRTPLNSIIGFTNMASKSLDNKEKLKENHEKILESGRVLLSIINNILDISRIEAGKGSLNIKKTDIYTSFDSIKGSLQEFASVKNISLSFEHVNITDRYIYADWDKCTGVFLNMVSNSIKYTEKGGTIKVRCEQLKEEKKGCAEYKFTFEDNGIGMSQEQREHIFEENAPHGNRVANDVPGTGLNLVACKAFIDLMNGTIECESMQGVGTVFTIVIPFKICSTAEEPEEETDTGYQSEKGHTADFRGKKILLVEDNEMNLEIAESLLTDEGFDVETAKDGLVAIKKLEENGPVYYDCILMDIQMPIINGYEATKKIRKMYPGANIPIIAVSANALEKDRQISISNGLNEHIAKPINSAELKAVLKEFI